MKHILNNSKKDEPKYESLSADKEENTKIMAGHNTYTVKQLQEEINSNSDIGRKLKSIEKDLEKY